MAVGSPTVAPVSIHAPAWGATVVGVLLDGGLAVSIHAPAWGATTPPTTSSPPTKFQFTLPRGERPHRPRRQALLPSFNSRSRVGSDAPLPAADAGHEVSIHAPAWGATRARQRQQPADIRFNSRSRVGSDLRRPPCRCGSRSFNSRSRVGSDAEDSLKSAAWCVSIHAPAWGATRRPGPSPPSWTFQFTLPRGERRFAPRTTRSTSPFQFTLPRGERLL